MPKLIPKCTTPDENGNTQCLGHSAEGYITPCCYIDSYIKERGIPQDIFYQEKFKISNVEDIKDITQSKEWIDFYTMLQENPADAPRVCYEMCGTGARNRDKYSYLRAQNKDNFIGWPLFKEIGGFHVDDLLEKND